MTVDLSNLKLVEEVIENVSDESYKDAQEFPPPPPEGLYTLIQGKPDFSTTNKGALKAQMNHVISGGEFAGQKVMFDRVNNQTFEREGVKANFMKDHLRAVYGPNGPRVTSHAEYADALAAAEGKDFKAKVIWEGSCGHKDTPSEGQDYVRVKGQRNFPATCKTCGKEIRPNATISIRVVHQ